MARTVAAALALAGVVEPARPSDVTFRPPLSRMTTWVHRGLGVRCYAPVSTCGVALFECPGGVDHRLGERPSLSGAKRAAVTEGE